MRQIPTIETQRLILRPLTANDPDEVERLAGDWAIANTTLNIPHPYPDGLAAKWIGTHQEAFERDEGVTFGITRKPDRALVGVISLHDMVRGHQGELGYWVGKPYWNQGYCSEAGRAVLRFAFDELGFVRVHACYISRNPASGRVMEKLGMRHEGCRRQHVRKWDKCEDLELYGILKQEWDGAA